MVNGIDSPEPDKGRQTIDHAQMGLCEQTVCLDHLDDDERMGSSAGGAPMLMRQHEEDIEDRSPSSERKSEAIHPAWDLDPEGQNPESGQAHMEQNPGD